MIHSDDFATSPGGMFEFDDINPVTTAEFP